MRVLVSSLVIARLLERTWYVRLCRKHGVDPFPTLTARLRRARSERALARAGDEALGILEGLLADANRKLDEAAVAAGIEWPVDTDFAAKGNILEAHGIDPNDVL